MKRIIIGCFALFSLLMSWSQTVAQNGGADLRSCEIIPLQGIWKFKLDPFFTGISSNGVQLMPQLPEEITLPGSTDQAGKGIKTQDMTSLRLTRLFEYKGAAWYEKEIFIPLSWKNKDVRLFLERAHWETSVWVNGQPAGKQESLSTPHSYDLGALLQPGKKNIIRIRVDNNMIYNIEYSHAVSAETQTNWNGIIGRMELQAYDRIHLEDIQVYPQLPQKAARFQITIFNRSKELVKGHEIGQWCVYPDYNEISKYNGVLKPYNYELFRESLREHHMIDLASAFTMASGKFQVLQKKEEIESYLRTQGFGGYHLLQLNDFPGQGTAPVGVVDIFWDPKKYVTAKEFNRFQAPVVPLLRTDSFTYTNDQTFTAAIQFANFGKGPIPAASIEWSLQYEDGKIYQQGKFKKDIPLGSPVSIGDVAPTCHAGNGRET